MSIRHQFIGQKNRQICDKFDKCAQILSQSDGSDCRKWQNVGTLVKFVTNLMGFLTDELVPNCVTCVKVQFLQQVSKQTFPENLKFEKIDYHFRTEVVLEISLIQN